MRTPTTSTEKQRLSMFDFSGQFGGRTCVGKEGSSYLKTLRVSSGSSPGKGGTRSLVVLSGGRAPEAFFRFLHKMALENVFFTVCIILASYSTYSCILQYIGHNSVYFMYYYWREFKLRQFINQLQMADTDVSQKGPPSSGKHSPRAFPSRNPLPLSATQEAQVRGVYYARVRALCAKEINGFLSSPLSFTLPSVLSIPSA